MRRFYLPILILVMLSTARAQMSSPWTGTLNGHGLNVNVGGSWSTYLANFKVGGVSMFSIDQTGAVVAAGGMTFAGTSTASSLTVSTAFSEPYYVAVGRNVVTATTGRGFIATSADGLDWTLLDTAGIYSGTAAHGISDPTIIRANGYYWMATTRWGEHNDKFALYRSDDLTTWTLIAEPTVRTGFVAGMEWFVDTDGTISLIWESDTDIYYTRPTNAGWTTWAASVDTTLGNVFDPYISRKGSTYYAAWFSKIDYKTHVQTASSLTGPWTTVWTSAVGMRFPSLVQKDASTWRIYMTTETDDPDFPLGYEYPAGFYYAESTNNFSTATTPTLIANTFGGATNEIIAMSVTKEPGTRKIADLGATAQGRLPLTGGALTGAVTTTSTVDGIDLSTIPSTYAPLASPSFTGNLTMSTGGATVDGVDVGAIPSTYAPLASPALTGTVTIGAADTNLYRSDAHKLKTDDSLTVGTNLYVDGNAQIGSEASDAHLIFGSLDSLNPADDIPLINGTTIDGVRPSTHAHTGTGGGGTITASSITNVPAGNVAAVTVQAATTELDNEKRLWKPEDVLDYPTCGPRKCAHIDGMTDYIFYQGAGEAGVVRGLWFMLPTGLPTMEWADLKTYNFRLRIYTDLGNIADPYSPGTPTVDIPLDTLFGAQYRTKTLSLGDDIDLNGMGMIRAGTLSGEFTSDFRFRWGGFGNGRDIAIPYSNGCLIEIWSDAGGGLVNTQVTYAYTDYDDGPIPTWPYSAWRLRAAEYNGSVAHDATATFMNVASGSGMVIGSFCSADANTDETFYENNVSYATDGVSGSWEASSYEDYFDQPFYYGWGANIRQDAGAFFVDHATFTSESYRWLTIPFSNGCVGTWANTYNTSEPQNTVSLNWLTLYYSAN